jgi:hypothetical protein
VVVGGCIPAAQFAERVSCVGVGLNITPWADDDSEPILAAVCCHGRHGGGHYDAALTIETDVRERRGSEARAKTLARIHKIA